MNWRTMLGGGNMGEMIISALQRYPDRIAFASGGSEIRYDEIARRVSQLMQAFASLGLKRGDTVAQLAIAWVAGRGEDIVPLIGARKRERLAEALGALDVKLTPAELVRIDEAAPPEAVAGTRYAPEQMAMLDSER